MSCFISLPTKCLIVHFYVLLKEEYIQYCISFYSHWSFLLLVSFGVGLLTRTCSRSGPGSNPLETKQNRSPAKQKLSGSVDHKISGVKFSILKRWWKTAVSPTFSGQCRHTVRPATLVALQPSKGIVRNVHFLTPSQTGSLSTTLSMKMPKGSQMKGTALLGAVAFLGGLFV